MRDRAIPWWKSADWWMVIVTGLAAIFAGASAWLFYFQLEDVHKTAITDQRAWVQITKVPDAQIKEGEPIKATVTEINTGKTYAREVETQIVVEEVFNGASPSFDYRQPHHLNKRALLFPNSEPDQIVAFQLSSMRPNPSNPPLLRHDDYIQLSEGKAYVAVYGTINYLDAFGIKRWVHFCSWAFIGGVGPYTAAACTAYNDTDND